MKSLTVAQLLTSIWSGPEDLSTTIRYQRDDVFHFLHYYLRFLLFIWAELPTYFIKKGKTNLAVRAFLSEASSYAFLYYMTRLNPKASTFVFLLPFAILRFALMVGNWGQHALVDEVDPNSDFRTSITMIDVMVSPTISPMGYCCSPMLTSGAEQSCLLQRRLPHRTPSQSTKTLARPSSALSQIEGSVSKWSSARLPRYRLVYDDGEAFAERLHVSCSPIGPHWRSNWHEPG